MPYTRLTMKFVIPVQISGIQNNTLNGRRLIPCYISPQRMTINENKLITQTVTKGGYVIEYWGEQLPTIEVEGTTGSGGFEAVEILRSIYRNEQFQMEKVLRERARTLSLEANSSLQNTTTSTAQAGIVSALDSLFENGFSEIIDGVKSTVEEITDIFEDTVEETTNPVTLVPSLGAFAVSVDLYMQGLKYRGYFSSFSVTESAEEPGLFNYNFSFNVLRRVGNRRNFMPWHRNPFDANGNPIEASIPVAGPKPEELSFQSDFNTVNKVVSRNTINRFVDSAPLDTEKNNVGVSRANKVAK